MDIFLEYVHIDFDTCQGGCTYYIVYVRAGQMQEKKMVNPRSSEWCKKCSREVSARGRSSTYRNWWFPETPSGTPHNKLYKSTIVMEETLLSYEPKSFLAHFSVYFDCPHFPPNLTHSNVCPSKSKILLLQLSPRRLQGEAPYHWPALNRQEISLWTVVISYLYEMTPNMSCVCETKIPSGQFLLPTDKRNSFCN